MTKNVWVLSGGGAKGCFQAGAIHHLATHNTAYQPDTIAGTSVGALNSLLPAQSWEWPLQNIADLMQVWLDLGDTSDMFQISAGAKLFENDRFNQTLLAAAGFNLASLSDFLIGGNYAPDAEEFEGYEIDFFPSESNRDVRARRTSRFRLAARFLAKILVPSPSINLSLDADTAFQVADLVTDLGKIKSFYSLTPIANLIRQSLDFDQFRSNTDCTLKLVSTSINNNRVGYMTRAGGFIQIEHVEPGSLPFSTNVNEVAVPALTRRDRLRNLDRIIDGTLASAAIPGAFPPKLINGHVCFDGGVTDTLPTRVVVNDVAQYLRDDPREQVRVISIRCNPRIGSLGKKPYFFGDTVPRPRPSELSEESVLYTEAEAKKLSLLGYIPGLISAMNTEIDRADDFELNQFGDAIETVDIYPTFTINGTAQIDPGLIRIQLSYGWMRAFDVLSGTSEARFLSDQIILGRLHAWRLEELSKTDGNSRRFVPGAIPKVRQMKVFVKRKVEERIDKFGEQSMPRHQDKHFAWDEKWYNNFERHVWSTDRTPWDSWVDMRGNDIPSDAPPW